MRGASLGLIMALACPVAAQAASKPVHLAATPSAKAKARKKSKTNAPGKAQKQTKNGRAQAAPDANDNAAKLAPPPPLPNRYRGVALLPVSAYDVDDELVQAQTGALLNEIDEVNGMQSISPQDVLSETATFGLHVEACDRDLSCLAQAGRYSRAHLAMEVRLSGLGGTLNMAVRLIDTVKGTELARVAEPLSDDADARLQQTHRIAVQLLNPTAYVGDLSVTCPTAGAEVYLDDKLLGQTPLSGQANLPAGLHVLRVSKAGYSDINRFVDVVYNRASTVQVDFNDTTVAGVIVEQVSTTGFGELYLLTNEAGLEVRIDGEPVGVTPLRGSINKIAAGVRHISLRKAGQPPVTLEVEVKANLRNDMVLRADPAGGAPTLQSLGAVPASRPLPDLETAINNPNALIAAANASQTPVAVAAAPEEVHTFPTWRYYTGIVLGAVGAVGIGAFGYFAHEVSTFNAEAAQIAKDSKTANWDLTTLTAKEARLADLNKKGPQAAIEQWASLGVGVALVATGAGLIVYDIVRTEPAPPPPAPTPETPTPEPQPAAPPPAPQSWLIPFFSRDSVGLALGTTW